MPGREQKPVNNTVQQRTVSTVQIVSVDWVILQGKAACHFCRRQRGQVKGIAGTAFNEYAYAVMMHHR